MDQWPLQGGKHDKVIYHIALKQKILKSKSVFCDPVYGTKSSPEDNKKLSLPKLCILKILSTSNLIYNIGMNPFMLELRDLKFFRMSIIIIAMRTFLFMRLYVF